MAGPKKEFPVRAFRTPAEWERWLATNHGYSLEVTRAAAFHFMAIGQLFLVYPTRHTAIGIKRARHDPAGA